MLEQKINNPIEEALVSKDATSKAEVRSIKNAMSMDLDPKRRKIYQNTIDTFQGDRDRRAKYARAWRSDIPRYNKKIQENPNQKDYWNALKNYDLNMARNAARPWIQQNQKATSSNPKAINDIHKNKYATTMFENTINKIERLIEEAISGSG